MFGLFGKKPDFMTLLQEAKGNKDAVVIDVREPDEYVQGHVPGSINMGAIGQYQGELEK